MKTTSVLGQPCAAQLQVFASPELLGSVLQYLTATEFCHLQLARPQTVAIAKSYRSLRRKFFFETDPDTDVLWGDPDEFRINPACEMILSTAGWYIERHQATYGVRKALHGLSLFLRKKHDEPHSDVRREQQSKLARFLPHMIISQPARPTKLQFLLSDCFGGDIPVEGCAGDIPAEGFGDWSQMRCLRASKEAICSIARTVEDIAEFGAAVKSISEHTKGHHADTTCSWPGLGWVGCKS